MGDKEVHSMAEVIIVTQVDHLEVTIFILLVEMVVKEDPLTEVVTMETRVEALSVVMIHTTQVVMEDKEDLSMVEVIMATPVVAHLEAMINIIPMETEGKEGRSMVAVTLEVVEDPLEVMTHIIPTETVVKVAHSMEEETTVTLMAVLLEAMTLTTQMEMEDTEDHSMVEVIIITLGVAEENILTMPVPILVQSRRF